MSNGVVFVGREKEIEDFRSAVNSLEDGGRAMLVVGAADPHYCGNLSGAVKKTKR